MNAVLKNRLLAVNGPLFTGDYASLSIQALVTWSYDGCVGTDHVGRMLDFAHAIELAFSFLDSDLSSLEYLIVCRPVAGYLRTCTNYELCRHSVWSYAPGRLMRIDGYFTGRAVLCDFSSAMAVRGDPRGVACWACWNNKVVKINVFNVRL